MKRTIIYFVVFITLVFPVSARDIAMPRLAIPTAATNGFGGTHIAYTDNVFALLVNPAAIMRVQQMSFFTLAPSLMNPQMTVDSIRYTRDALSAMDDDNELGDFFGEIADKLSDRHGKLAMGLELREFPLSFAWVANGFGVGAWSRSYMNVVNIEGLWLSTNNYVDLVIPVGFAFKILDFDSHAVDIGITLKPFARAIFQGQETITELTDGNSELAAWLDTPLMMGFGFDLGLLYRWNTGLSAGVTFTDIYTRGNVIRQMITDEFNNQNNNTYYIPFAMNLGVAYDFRLGNFWSEAPSLLSSLGFTVALDWRNFTGVFQQDDYLNYRNTALDIGVGLQVSWLDMFKVRVGMSEMLPAFGLGFAIGPFEIDLAYYGRELGREPGLFPTAVVDLSIAFRPQAKERNWIWARRSIVGLITGGEASSASESN